MLAEVRGIRTAALRASLLRSPPFVIETPTRSLADLSASQQRNTARTERGGAWNRPAQPFLGMPGPFAKGRKE